MLYSHIWDGLLKLGSLFAVAIVVVRLHLDDRLSAMRLRGGVTTALIIALIAIPWAVLYREGLSTIAAWLYANVNLGARVSLGEARQLARLFQLDLSMKWIPLKEVKKLPRADRHRAVMAALETIAPKRRAMLL